MIELSYDPANYIPVGIYPEQDAVIWLRLARRQLGTVQYVRAMARHQGNEKSTVHRIVMGGQGAATEEAAANWTLGLFKISEIPSGQVSDLVEYPVAGAVTDAGKRSWTASRGLRRI